MMFLSCVLGAVVGGITGFVVGVYWCTWGHLNAKTPVDMDVQKGE